MSESYKLLMAKTDPEDNGLWLPLWMHLKDTAGVMRKLVHQWIPQSVVNASGLEFHEFEAVAIFTAAVHDIGKATSYFQNLITLKNPEKRADLTDAGFPLLHVYRSSGKTPHSYAGQWILQSSITGFGIPRSITDVVGAHHGKPIGASNRDLIPTYETNFFGVEGNEPEKKIWTESWKYILSDALCEAGLDSVGELPELTKEAQVLLSGLLITADWIASNTCYFPLISSDESGSDALYPARVREGFQKTVFPEGWHPETLRMDPQLFQERFGFLPNEVQSTLIRAVESCENPGIFILEAQMGVGKTEAGLAAAELLASRQEAGGIFFGLPTQATSNGLFPRLYNWAVSVSEDTETAIRLAHGAAEFNEDYEKLLETGKALVNNIGDDLEGNDSGVNVHPWFQGGKKALLADFVIGTVDQFLMASLRRRHFMLRHLGLAGKIVIIDECHAYDAYMNVYLQQSLKWMASYGIPVILLSATLPAEKRAELVDCYQASYAKSHFGKRLKRKADGIDGIRTNISYPLLTWTDGETLHQEKIEQNTKETRIYLEKSDSLDAVIHELRDSLVDGGCACVILNTVKLAQEAFQEIRQKIPDAKVLLYHAQFTMPDRAGKEQELLRHLGKNSTESDRYKFILIGTQVLEQSLDYDADIMISQPCPIDLLLQRMGRLHRHARVRPDSMKKPRCILLTADGDASGESHPGIFDSGTKAVYGDYLLTRTWQTIKDMDYITLPSDIPALIQRVYSDDSPNDTAEIETMHQEFILEQKGMKRKAKNYCLSVTGRSIEGILDNADETAESSAECKVRDGTSSLEVILLQRASGGLISDVNQSGDFLLDPAYPLTSAEGKFAARQRLRLPHIFSQPWNIHRTIKELESRNMKELAIWQQSPWIKGDLILLLDENGQTRLCDYLLSYDNESGLKYSKLEDANGNERI